MRDTHTDEPIEPIQADAALEPSSDDAVTESPFGDEVWADDAEDADDIDDTDEPAEQPRARQPAADSAEQPPRDPWVHVLLVVALSLVVALIATTAALYFYVSALNKAPRTMTERDVSMSEAMADENPSDVTSWASLAYAYAKAGRLEDALTAIRRGEKLENGEALAVVEADVLRTAGKYREAVAAYDRAEIQTNKLRERIRAERAKVGITGDILDDGALFQVFWGRAMAKEALDDVEGAIEDYRLAVEQNPRQSTVWVSLGELQLKSGDSSEAAGAFREALRFTPDLPEALDGLKRAGE